MANKITITKTDVAQALTIEELRRITRQLRRALEEIEQALNNLESKKQDK
jgi:G3E family GTPase